jgi:DNA-binding response OmpR family regulator
MTATGLSGRSVFLVEDEVMIRMMVADMLEELGYKVAAEAGDITEALRLAQATEFDIAILDVNVNGKVISPVADVIKAKGCPFIFATGYGSSGLPEQYRDRPALQKPFQLDALGKTIEAALRSGEQISVARMERSAIRESRHKRRRPRIALRSIRATGCDSSALL